MNQSTKKRQARLNRHKRVRAKITGTKAVPRVAVFRSIQHIYAQVVDDQTGQTVFSVHNFQSKETNKTKSSQHLGGLLGEELKKKNIHQIVFDRGGFKYHGRVKALADGLRGAGIKF